MTPTDFVTIYTSFNDLKVVRRIFPTILAEASRSSSALIVHDCSTVDTEAAWNWYRELRKDHDFFYMFSPPMQFAMARNICLALAVEMYVPQYICMLEDDHGYQPGAVDALRTAMAARYGSKSANGLRYGLFSLCPNCWGEPFRGACIDDGTGNLFPSPGLEPMKLGGANSCCRAAPTSHWVSVLKGYDLDEYPISFYQTRNLNFRNYHRGFTTLYVGGGKLVHRAERPGVGVRTLGTRFDDRFTASDPRSQAHRK